MSSFRESPPSSTGVSKNGVGRRASTPPQGSPGNRIGRFARIPVMSAPRGRDNSLRGGLSALCRPRCQATTVTSPSITKPTPTDPNCSLMRSRLFQGVPHRVL